MRVALMYSAQAGPRATIDIHALARGADEPMRHSVEPRAMAFDSDQAGARAHQQVHPLDFNRGEFFEGPTLRLQPVLRVEAPLRFARSNGSEERVGDALGMAPRTRHGKGLAHHASRTDPVTLPNFVVDHCLGETMVPRRGPTKTSVVNGLECPTEATRTIAFQQLLSELSHRTWWESGASEKAARRDCGPDRKGFEPLLACGLVKRSIGADGRACSELDRRREAEDRLSACVRGQAQQRPSWGLQGIRGW